LNSECSHHIGIVDCTVVVETANGVGGEREASGAGAAEQHRARVVSWRAVRRAIGLIADEVTIKINQ
jgi:hypothetical protein